MRQPIERRYSQVQISAFDQFRHLPVEEGDHSDAMCAPSTSASVITMTFFYRQMPKLIEGGNLSLAVPPLSRLSHGGKIFYARDDKHKDVLLKKEFHPNAKVEVSRFKGLGEMMAAQLKETTMDAGKRTLLRVVLVDKEMNRRRACGAPDGHEGRGTFGVHPGEGGIRERRLARRLTSRQGVRAPSARGFTATALRQKMM